MKERSIETLPLDGGVLCLNFINTVHDYLKPDPYDYLEDYSDLLEWSEKAGLMSSEERETLSLLAQSNIEGAARVHREAIELRGLFYELFRCIANGQMPDRHTQDTFNARLQQAMRFLKLTIDKEMQVEQLWDSPKDLAYPMRPVLKSAYELLTSGKLERVKACGACGWLFFDKSKNRSRKWCSMESCGSNEKAKRYYHRTKNKKED
ncbi:CGNR zinc finger domain-containing protein [Fodinibius sediminis]|uniref:Conserved protein containing a Zn-ribbon-like motif, possibly RNA-binding n=1 Tax=Fodinibius sediminis TaxID=1214077 RepID=A0A521BH60_9BACT|nr:ABATE domain-containing protein [Fodinibius sediminis]SMO46271.1 Conserved protein containing a Zn-ribbon-like motif, possibly RNA-binding [Fodinibius sediminis]